MTSQRSQTATSLYRSRNSSCRRGTQLLALTTGKISHNQSALILRRLSRQRMLLKWHDLPALTASIQASRCSPTLLSRALPVSFHRYSSLYGR
jgi:hypothetical protein